MRTLGKMAVATLAFAAIHSALASRTAKRVAGNRLGDIRRDAGYRTVYVVQSLLGFAALTAYGASLPKETVYEVTGPWALLLRLGQALGLLQLLAGLREVGFTRWAGLANLQAYRRGQPLPVGPVAQGPEMAGNGRLTTGGPFRKSRHPLNFSGIPIFWLTPHMTSRRLGFNVASTVYLIIGSVHEEARLKEAYGDAYRAYADSGVPFFLPSRKAHAMESTASVAGCSAIFRHPPSAGTPEVP